MSSVLPYDVIVQIIDNVGETNDLNLIKELALVSHSFRQICAKHLFATVYLHDDVPMRQASSKKGFVKLLKRRPDIVKHIRKLTYKVEYDHRFQSTRSLHTYPCDYYDDNRLSPILPDFLRTISFLNCLTITAPRLVDWNIVDSSLTSAFLHLMHLPTINHIDLSFIENFPLSSLTSTTSVNLRRLDISNLSLEEDDSPETVVLSGMMPRLREFNTRESSELTTKLLSAKTRDGQPALNFMDLRRLTISSFFISNEEWNLRYLLRNSKLIEKLHLSVGSPLGLEGLHDILSPSASTLKELDLTVRLYSPGPLAELCVGLEAMAGHNILESLSIVVFADGSETADFVGSAFQEVEEVLVKPEWFALRQVTFEVVIDASWATELYEALQSLPDKYLSHLPKLESIAFDYECYLDDE